MTPVTLREGSGSAEETFIFYLNGWADLPFCAQGLDAVPEQFRVIAWVPPAPHEAARLVSIERANEEHLAQTPAAPRFTLIGYSHGGIGALSAARLMQRDGATGVRLVILDSVSPQTFRDLPLEVEFCRSAPFFAPPGGPLVDGLRECQRALTGRPVSSEDFHAAITLVARNASHMAELAAGFDPTLAGMDPAALVEKLTEWLCYLLLLRGVGQDRFTGPAEYIHSLEGREDAAKSTGDEDHEVAAWRWHAPGLTRHYIGDRHWGLLTDEAVQRVIFRL